MGLGSLGRSELMQPKGFTIRPVSLLAEPERPKELRSE
jgi:hypothetical protein